MTCFEHYYAVDNFPHIASSQLVTVEKHNRNRGKLLLYVGNKSAYMTIYGHLCMSSFPYMNDLFGTIVPKK